jgi:hypothetical protein
VVIDRALGIAGLGGLVLIGFALTSGASLSPLVPAIVLAIATLPLLGLAAIAMFGRRIAAGAPAWLAGLAAVWAAGDHRHGRLAAAALLAVACHAISAVAMTALARDLGHDLTYGQGMLLFPAVLLAGMLPISFGGWGLREVAAIELLASAGIPPAAAVSVSLLFIGVLLVESLVGTALWFLLQRRRPAPQGT